MFLFRAKTNLRTTNIPLRVREDAFPHELNHQGHNRFLAGDNLANPRSSQQSFGAVSFSIALHVSGPPAQ